MIQHYSVMFNCDAIIVDNSVASAERCAETINVVQAPSLDFNRAIKYLTSIGWRVYTNHNGELRTKCPQCRAKHPPDPESPFKQPRDDT